MILRLLLATWPLSRLKGARRTHSSLLPCLAAAAVLWSWGCASVDEGSWNKGLFHSTRRMGLHKQGPKPAQRGRFVGSLPTASCKRARLLPSGSCSSNRSRCSRNSMEISSRARPARQKSRATSLMVLPPRLLWTRKRSHSTVLPEMNC